jgi:flavin-dependent dehydrogenase
LTAGPLSWTIERGRTKPTISTEGSIVRAAGQWDFDVAVIGGGPGGSSTATALARRGGKVLLLERDRFPRFHIGESQLPWSSEIFRALGVDEAIATAGFVQKWGASFRAFDGTTEQYADFAAAVETPTPRTIQVPRARFDEILLRHAARCGVTVLEEHRALEAVFEADGVALRFAGPEGAEQTVRVGAVVDASGRAGFLAKKLGRHEVDPLLRNIAVHAQYEGVPRSEGRRAGDIRMFTRPDMGWIWFIPLSETVMSVGAVIPQAVHRPRAKPTAEESLESYLADTPAAALLLEEARRISPARFDADYSYLGTRLAGDRWLAVGDAAAFLDPIFSTGVLLAMQAGLEAADALHAGLAAGDLSSRRFVKYERRVRRRYHHFRRFAVGFYDQDFRELWFARSPRRGVFRAILSVLAGNWRPSLPTRLRLEMFFGLVALRRLRRVLSRAGGTAAR